MPIVECAYCGKDVEVTNYQISIAKNNFCNKQCQGEYNRGRKSNKGTARDIKVSCAWCGKEKYVKSYNYNENQNYFCDIHCFGKYNTANAPSNVEVELTCEHCGKKYKRKKKNISKKHKLRFCSRQCAASYKKKRVVIECAWCGKPVEKNECHLDRSDEHFCSPLCVRRWSASNRGRTGPEQIVAEILEDNNIKYNEQVPVYGRYLADFVVGKNKIIEVYGDYFHANPEVYGDGPDLLPFVEWHEERIEIDKERTSTLLKKGYDMLILWEKDINDGLAESMILEYI